jgi:thioesterase domain-containing protein
MDESQVESMHALSPAQLGMLLASAVAPGTGLYVEQLSFVLESDLDREAFSRACRRLVERHPMLRTAFVWKKQEEPLQVVLKQATLEIALEDWQGSSAAGLEARIEGFLQLDRERGFDLAQPPLMRVAVIRLGPAAVRLAWTHHHILMDGWCQSTLLAECLELYLADLSGREPRLESPRPYSDYVEWLGRQDLERARGFWRRALAGVQPTRLRQSEGEAGHEGYRSVEGSLGQTADAALHALARRHHVTLSTTVQGAWAVLLSRYSGSDDVVFGITVSGRPPQLPGIESTIGLFINTLPVRARLDRKARFWEWLGQLQGFNVELREFEHTPAGELNRWLGIADSEPLFGSVLVFENYPSPMAGEGALAGRPGQLRTDGARTRYPLVILATDEERLALQVVQDGRLEPRAADSILRQLTSLLESVAGNPELRLADLLDAIPEGEVVHERLRRRAGSALGPSTPTQVKLAGIWASVLGSDGFGVHDSFFDLGGNSQLVVRMMTELRAAFGIDLPLGAVFDAQTIAGLAERIDRLSGGESAEAPSALVPLQPRGERPPLFCPHPINGQVLCYMPLAGEFWPEQPLYGLQAADDAEEPAPVRIETLAARYLAAVRAQLPTGPYRLGGWSMGGLIAFEMAKQLVEAGEQVALLAVIDTPLPATLDDPHDEDDDFAGILRLFPMELTAELRGRKAEPGRNGFTPDERLRHVRDALYASGLIPEGTALSWIQRVQAGYRARRQAVRRWRPRPYPGRVTYFRGTDQQDALSADDGYGWAPYTAQPVEVHLVPGDHDSLVAWPHVAELAKALKDCLRATELART